MQTTQEVEEKKITVSKYRQTYEDRGAVALMREHFGINVVANEHEVVRQLPDSESTSLVAGFPRQKYRVGWEREDGVNYNYGFVASMRDFERGVHPGVFDFVREKVSDALLLRSEGVGSAEELGLLYGVDYSSDSLRLERLFLDLVSSRDRVVEMLGSWDSVVWLAERLDELER